MPQEFKPGCARPTGGVVGEKEKEIMKQDEQSLKEEEKTMLGSCRKCLESVED